MVKILYEKWDENRELLKEEIEDIKDISDLTYRDLVILTFSNIYNKGTEVTEYLFEKLDCSKVTEIDNGDYQGTLLFLIPFDTYQPGEHEYLMTFAGYGSCSGCDTLLSITEDKDGKPNAQQVNDLLTLCKDLVMNTIKPYNDGWRYSPLFDTVSF